MTSPAVPPGFEVWLLSWHLKGFLVLSVTLLLAWMLRGRSAALRHFVLLCGFLALIPTAFSWPGWIEIALPVPTQPLKHELLEGSSVRQSALPTDRLSEADHFGSGSGFAGAVQVRTAGGLASTRTTNTLPAPQLGTDPSPWNPWQILVWGMIFAWMVGVLFQLLQLISGELRIRKLVAAASRNHDSRLKEQVEEAAISVGLARVPARVLLSKQVRSPFTRGFWNPQLVLPYAFCGWNRERQRRVLIHELGHVQRKDFLSMRLAQIVGTLHWLNPLCWLAARQMDRLQEQACDDLVVNRLGGGPVYARDLLDLARGRAALGGQPAVLGTPSSFEFRLRALLDGSANRSPLRRTQQAAALCTALILAVVLGGIHPVSRAATTTQPELPSGWAVVLEDNTIQFLTDNVVEIIGIGRLRGQSKDRLFRFSEASRFELNDRAIAPGTALQPNDLLQVFDSLGRESWSVRLAADPSARPRGRRVGSARGTGVRFVFEPGEPAFYHLSFEEEYMQIEGWVLNSAQIGAKLDPVTDSDSLLLQVRAVLEAGPADAAGLKIGDVVTAIDGRPATPANLLEAMSARQIGDLLPITLRSQEATVAKTIQIGSAKPESLGTPWKGTKFRQ